MLLLADLGGGKTVVMGAPDKENEEAFYRALGRYVNTLNGRYYTAEDVGTSEHVMNLIYKKRHMFAVQVNHLVLQVTQVQ